MARSKSASPRRATRARCTTSSPSVAESADSPPRSSSRNTKADAASSSTTTRCSAAKRSATSSSSADSGSPRIRALRSSWCRGKAVYTDRFYEMIGMDRSSFAYQTWRGPAPEMPLAHSPYETPGNYGFYFGPQFGQRPGGGGGVWVMDPWGRKLEGAPISDATKAELLRWGTERVDGPRPQTEGDDVSRQLDSITLEDHLMARYNISRETVRT